MAFYIERKNDVISSKNNPFVVRLSKLEDKKYREKEALFCLDGIKLLYEAVDHCASNIEYIIVRDDALKRVLQGLDDIYRESNIECKGEMLVLSDAAFGKLSREKSPEGVITVVRYLEGLHKRNSESEKEYPLISGKTVMLEAIRDPGNLGTIMRTAAAFGVKNLILTGDCADIYSPKTLRAAMGAIFKISSLRLGSSEEALRLFRGLGRRTLATALGRDSLRLGDFELSETDVFIIGNEGHGLSDGTVSLADESVFIPMLAGTESLNAAIAASVCMWELSKT